MHKEIKGKMAKNLEYTLKLRISFLKRMNEYQKHGQEKYKKLLRVHAYILMQPTLTRSWRGNEKHLLRNAKKMVVLVLGTKLPNVFKAKHL